MMMQRKGKQVTALLALAMCLAGSVRAAQDDFANNFLVRCELYVWNRFADFLEINRGGLAVGPAIGAEIAITDQVQLGAYASNERGVSFPIALPTPVGVLVSPPLWTVPYLEGESMFTTHGGKYWTRSYGPNRRESTIAKEVRFERQKWDVRAQVALGLVHAYYAFDTMEAYDFLAGIFTFDPKMDDETLDPTAIRQPARQLGRGLSNVFLGLSEIPQCMIETTRQQGDYAGATTGFAQGVWRCVLREGVGVMEVVTFPMGWDPIIEPEYPALPTRSSDWQVNRPQFRERL